MINGNDLPALAAQLPVHPNQLGYESEYPSKCWRKLQTHHNQTANFK